MNKMKLRISISTTRVRAYREHNEKPLNAKFTLFATRQFIAYRVRQKRFVSLLRKQSELLLTSSQITHRRRVLKINTAAARHVKAMVMRQSIYNNFNVLRLCVTPFHATNCHVTVVSSITFNIWLNLRCVFIVQLSVEPSKTHFCLAVIVFFCSAQLCVCVFFYSFVEPYEWWNTKETEWMSQNQFARATQSTPVLFRVGPDIQAFLQQKSEYSAILSLSRSYSMRWWDTTNSKFYINQHLLVTMKQIRQ